MDKVARRRRRFAVLGGVLLSAYAVFFSIGGCADHFLLHPSHKPIGIGDATRGEVTVPGRPPVELFVRQQRTTDRPPEAYLLLLDGNACRAERAVAWGGDFARDHSVEVWAINYPGFGGSPGPARLSGIAPAALAAFDALRAKAGSKPVVVWGGSLGTTAALYVAAHRSLSGLILSNPPPLRQLLVGHYGWWNLWLVAFAAAHGVPNELDSLANAPQVQCPTIVCSAGEDSTVPPRYQQSVIDHLTAPMRVVRLPQGGHGSSASADNPTA